MCRAARTCRSGCQKARSGSRRRMRSSGGGWSCCRTFASTLPASALRSRRTSSTSLPQATIHHRQGLRLWLYIFASGQGGAYLPQDTTYQRHGCHTIRVSSGYVLPSFPMHIYQVYLPQATSRHSQGSFSTLGCKYGCICLGLFLRRRRQ
eukprot:scaffold41569_cov17-Tisochrysis_lutea.AAC.2